MRRLRAYNFCVFLQRCTLWSRDTSLCTFFLSPHRDYLVTHSRASVVYSACPFSFFFFFLFFFVFAGHVIKLWRSYVLSCNTDHVVFSFFPFLLLNKFCLKASLAFRLFIATLCPRHRCRRRAACCVATVSSACRACTPEQRQRPSYLLFCMRRRTHTHSLSLSLSLSLSFCQILVNGTI